MLIHYSNYVKLKEAIKNIHTEFIKCGNSNISFAKHLIRRNILNPLHKSYLRWFIKKYGYSDLFYDYIIFLHYCTRNDVSFESNINNRFKLDITVNKKFLWKIFKKNMNLK